MNLIEELRYEISRSINTLRRRYANTADDKEKKVILQNIESLNDKLSILNQATLLDAAVTLSDTTQVLEQAVAAARKGPFDGYLAAIEGHLDRLQRLSGEMHGRDSLPPAPEEGAPEEIAAGEEPVPQPRARGKIAVKARGIAAGIQPPLAAKDYPTLKDEYQAYFKACKVRPGNEGTVAYYVKKLNQGRAMYEQVSRDLNGIPWAFIGIIHGMECGFNFAGHLHNGDPLTARTVQVPAGRPVIGAPPFTWRQSANDALTLKGYHEVTDWSVPRMLYLLEKYNGFGYRARRVPTPYLWSFSNLYEKGKFVKDGKFDPAAVSKQCGAALILKAVVG